MPCAATLLLTLPEFAMQNLKTIIVIVEAIIVSGILLYPRRLRHVSNVIDTMQTVQKEHNVKILYLRGFGVDGLRHKTMRLVYQSIDYTDTNFETELALSLGCIGHFIAIGLPSYDGDIGAERFAVETGQWQEEVLQLMHTSAMIIFRPSYSIGVMWELEQITKLGYFPKTIICFEQNEDDGLNYKLFREAAAHRISLPKSPSKYMTVAADGSIKKYLTLNAIPLYATLLEQGNERLKSVEHLLYDPDADTDIERFSSPDNTERNLIIAGGIFLILLTLGIFWYLGN